MKTIYTTIAYQPELVREQKFKYLWVLILICSLMLPLALQAQYTVYRCSEMGFRPKSYDPYLDLWTDILEYYLNPSSSGEDGDDCWVYRNSNGKDHVVIPNNWHMNLTADLRSLIDDTMAAMEVARMEFRTYGALDSDLYFLFEDRDLPDDELEPFAHNLIGNQCWMQSHIEYFNDYLSPPQNQFVIAHEVAHCFNMENIDDGDFVRNYEPYEWFDESVAEFLASEAYPTANNEFYNSRRFDLDDSAFTQPYHAWPLWYSFVLQKRKSSLVTEMNALIDHPNRRQRLRHFQQSGFDEVYHNFLVDFYTYELQDRGGGNIEIDTAISARQPETILIPDSPTPFKIFEIPAERMSIFVLKIPPSYDLTIYPPEERAEKVQYSILNAPDKIKNWNTKAEIEGYCDREREIRILASHLNEDPITDIAIRYELNESLYCCTLTAEISENPSPDNLNGQFHFDYYIESEVEMKADGTTQTMPMNYYVNSRDGSMLLVRSFFTDNFGTYDDGDMKADAVIWLANGQIVGYVQDKTFGQKRAITLDMNQTRADVMGPRAINPEELLREGQSSGVSPSALPSDSPWAGTANGYAYYREERFDPGVRNLMTAYISDEVSVVASPMSSFGFMVGHIKDLSGQNKHLVYTRYETPGGDVMKAKLHKLEKECASFNGAGYKKMTLGGYSGVIGAMSDSEREAFADSQMASNEQILALMAEMERCGDNENCKARVTREMMELEKSKQDAVYDLPSPGEFSGSAGSDFQAKERQVRDRMYALQDDMMDKDMHCKRLSRQNANCGGCMDMTVERCKRQLEDMERELEQLECEMAKLHGAGDMLDDCH